MRVCAAVGVSNEQVDGVQARGVRLKYGSRRREDGEGNVGSWQQAIYRPRFYPAESHSLQSRLARHPRFLPWSAPRLFGTPPHDLRLFEPSSGQRAESCAVAAAH